jgi:hypothetical protein
MGDNCFLFSREPLKEFMLAVMAVDDNGDKRREFDAKLQLAMPDMIRNSLTEIEKLIYYS